MMQKNQTLFAILITTLALFSLPFNISAAQSTIWQPAPGTTWQLQLGGEVVNPSWDVEMYDVDLYTTPQAVVDQLKNDGRIFICYFSAGSWENYRDDAGDFPPEVLGNALVGWPDEKWLDIRRIDLLTPIMRARLDHAVTRGCDGVDPDNMDGYTNNSGFPLTYNDQLAYNRWIAAEGRARGLSVGLKNDLAQIEDLVDDFDWALNEQCFYYDECNLLLPFIEAGKAVFSVEYEGSRRVYCPKALARKFSTLTKTLALGDEPPNACESPENARPGLNRFTTAPLVLSWQDITWADGYWLQIDDNADFSSPYYEDDTLAEGTLSVNLPLPPVDAYFWRVRAKKPNDGGWGAWSEAGRFYVEIG
jgi:hypothetical protein